MEDTANLLACDAASRLLAHCGLATHANKCPPSGAKRRSRLWRERPNLLHFLKSASFRLHQLGNSPFKLAC